mmetsp:Transcript_8502/g.12067  ORF Transcript_8502/g.12067 Transcript_8502/m.12067 type:complete len:140 (-) Transcript_8502:92-511(-)
MNAKLILLVSLIIPFMKKSTSITAIEMDETDSNGLTRNQWLDLFQTFSARLVLEVFGATGAIWGFSEALGLRTDETNYFWRPFALSFGVIFFIRWCLQIGSFLIETKQSNKLNTVDEVHVNSDDIETKELLNPNKKLYI